MITEVTSIPSCEKWRGQVLKEISRKVSKIQDPSLSDFMIRDLNDEINKAMREKHMWEVQIRNLGGPNYMRGGGKVYDEEGREIPGGGKGYRSVLRAERIGQGLICIDILDERKNFPELRSYSNRQRNHEMTNLWSREQICENRSMHRITAIILTRKMGLCWNMRYKRRERHLRTC